MAGKYLHPKISLAKTFYKFGSVYILLSPYSEAHFYIAIYAKRQRRYFFSRWRAVALYKKNTATWLCPYKISPLALRYAVFY